MFEVYLGPKKPALLGLLISISSMNILLLVLMSMTAYIYIYIYIGVFKRVGGLRFISLYNLPRRIVQPTVAGCLLINQGSTSLYLHSSLVAEWIHFTLLGIYCPL